MTEVTWASGTMAVAAVLGVVNTLGLGWLVRAIRQIAHEVATARVEPILERLAKLEDEVLVVKTRAEAVPDAEDIRALTAALEKLGGDLRAFDERIAGVKDTIGRIDRVVERHEQIIADAARRGA